MRQKFIFVALSLLIMLIAVLNFAKPYWVKQINNLVLDHSSAVERHFIRSVWRQELNDLTYDLSMHLRADHQLMNAIESVLEEPDDVELTQWIRDRFHYHFNTGYFTGGEVKPVSLAVYDTQWQRLALHSKYEDPDSHYALPDEYRNFLKSFSGLEQMQVRDSMLTGGLDRDVFYSVVIPVGNYRAKAFIELRVDPIYNLQALESLGVPVVIQRDQRIYHQSDIWVDPQENDYLGVNAIELADDFGAPMFTVMTQRDLSTTREHIEDFMSQVTIYGMLLVLLISGYLLWVYQTVMIPIQQVKEMMERMAQGYFDRRYEIESRDEIGVAQEQFNSAMDSVQSSVQRITKALNGESVHFEGKYSHQGELGVLEQQVIKVLQLQEQLRQALQKSKQTDILVQQSRHAMMGEMLAMISHQWKQPLTTLIMNEDLIRLRLRKENLTDESRDFLNQRIELNKELLRELDQTISDFRDFFHPDKEKSYFDIHQQVYSLIQMFEGLFQRSSILVSVQGSKTLVYGYERELRQVLSNLLKNAIDQLDESLQDVRSITIQFEEQDDCCVIRVSDNGGGIPEDILPTIFDAYVSTKALNGTGLGLYMSKTIVEDHFKGELKAFNSAEGACFEIHLPK